MLNNSNIEMDSEKVTSIPIVMSLSPDCYILSYTDNAENFFALQDNSSLTDQNLFDFIHEDDISKCEELIDSLSQGVTFEIDCRFKLDETAKGNKAIVFQMPHKYSRVMNEIIWVVIPAQMDDYFSDNLKVSNKYNFAIVESDNSFLFNHELTQLLGIEDIENISNIVFDQSKRKIDFEKLLSTIDENEILNENLYLKNNKNQYLPFSGVIVKHRSENCDSIILV
ncbi:hypothetical protein MNBD_IGNAVI01-1038, partial [hydrothermal vent metagenome]